MISSIFAVPSGTNLLGKPSSLPTEILTVEELAALLKMSSQQIYEMTRNRARARMPVPLPVLRVNGNLRFRRADITVWLDQMTEYERTGRLPSDRLQ